MKPDKQPPPPSSSVKQALLGLYGIIGVTISTFGPFKIPFAESHAKDYWRHAVAGIVLVLLLISGIVGLAILMFDANYFKSQMVDYVKVHTQRDLALEGDIKVTFFPQLGLDSGKMTLSQRNSSKRFASIENTHFNIAWWPLFRKQLQIERVTLEGVHANVTIFKNGSTNLDDLLSTDGSMGDITFEIDSFKLKNSSANLQDETTGILFSLHGINISTGKLSETTPGNVTANFRLESAKPHIDTQVKLNSHFLLELKTKHYEFANFDIAMEGEIAGINNLALNLQGTLNSFPSINRATLDKFTIHAKGKLENRKVEAKLDIPKLQLLKNTLSGNTLTFSTSLLQDGENISGTLELPSFEIADKKFKAGNTSANFDFFKAGNTLQGKLSSPLSFDFTSMQLQLPSIISNFSATHPQLGGKLNASVTGNMQTNFSEQNIKFGLKAKIDDSDVSGNLELQNFSRPAYSFDLDINKLDLDRYLSPEWSKHFRDDAPAIDFSWLKDLNMKGKLRSSEFKFAQLRAKSLIAEIKSDQSTLNIEPIQARFYDGVMQGSFNLSANDIPKVNFRQKLTGVKINSILSDLYPGEAKVSGKGSLIFDLNATGKNMSALRKSLNGSISVTLNRGAVAGLNLTESLLTGKDQLGTKDSEKTEAAKFTVSTPFSELKFSHDITEGKAGSSDFLMKSPIFSVKGEGETMLETGQLNYRLNTTISANLKRNSNGEIARLRGITIPMNITGHYATPNFKLDFGNASGMKESRPSKKIPEKPAPASAKTVKTTKK
jgi:AsmA protein